MLNLAGFGPAEHDLLMQAGIEGLRDILALSLDDFRARIARAAVELKVDPPTTSRAPAGGSRRRRSRRPEPARRGGPGHRCTTMAAWARPQLPDRRVPDGRRDRDRHRRVAILPFLSPPWVSFEQGRAQADLWTGFTPAELNAATGAILSDLVFGPPSFDVAVNGQPVLNEREQAHMRDVRGVFAGFALLAIVAAAGLVVAYAGARRSATRSAGGAAVRAGALGTIVGVVVGGVIVFFAFDAAFEVFHRLFFAGGTYLFDPATDRLVQLFPFKFWDETTMVVGGADRRDLAARRLRRRPSGPARGRARNRGRARARAAGRAARVGAGLVNGVPIARLFGIEIRLHLSWIFIVAIITATVGGQLAQLPPTADETPLPDATLAWAIGLAASLVFMLTVIAHELAHALVERHFGMKVTSISVHFIGSPAVVDVRAETPRAEAAIALAGPLTSLAIGLTSSRWPS